MNTNFWKNRTFTNENPIHFPCPFCDSGFLEPQNIQTEITPHGKEMESYNYPYGIDYVFSGILICKNNACRDLVSINGQCLKDIVYGKEVDGDLVEGRFSQYIPKFFYPNLKLFRLEKEVPKEVAEQINLSFSLYFSDLSSCGNRIRNSIELILDDLKASRWKKTKANRIHHFTKLHDRIEHFSKKNKGIGEMLLAIKIIGNEGSHVGEMKLEDIIDAYEILEEIIEYTYVNKRKRIAKIAKDIVVKNKPRSK